MDDSVVTAAILLFWGGVGLGLLLGGLAGWLGGFSWGIGVGCLVIGAGGLAGAGDLGWHQYQHLAGTREAKGVLVEYVTEEVRDSSGRPSTSYLPRVRFRDNAGAIHETRGLGGSRRFEPGDAVTVRYRPEQPERALIGDFQNLWGGTWALSLFGVVPTLFGAFFVTGAIAERRETAAPSRGTRGLARVERRPPEPASESPRPRSASVASLIRGLTLAGNLAFVSAFVAVFALPVSIERAMAIGFGLIAVACAIHFIGRVLDGAAWQAPFVFAIVGTGFGMFGFGLWMLGS